MDVLFWILFGGILGLIGALVSKRMSWDEMISTVLLGVLGSVLGGLVGNLIFRGDVSKFSIFSYFVAISVAFGLLLADKAYSKTEK